MHPEIAARYADAGLSADDVLAFRDAGVVHPQAVLAWAGSPLSVKDAARLALDGFPGPMAVDFGSERPRRRQVDRLSDHRRWGDGPGSGFGGAAVNGRRWDGSLVRVEAHIGAGLPGFDIVGVPGDQVRAVRDRVRAAILNGGFEWPGGRITMLGLGGVDSRCDHAIAYTILQASGQLSAGNNTSGDEMWGELGLDGMVRDADVGWPE